MKIKTINSILTKKFNDFVASIDDEAVRKLVKENTVITGGCIASLLLEEKVNDFDLYFTNKETVYAVAEYYVNKARAAEIAKLGQESLTMSQTYVLGGGFTTTEMFKKIKAKMSDGLGDTVDPEIMEKLNKEFGKIDQYRNDPERIRVYVPSRGFLGQLPDDDAVNEEAYELDSEPNAPETPENSRYSVAYISANAITLTNKIQIIIRFYGSPAEIHENYDFAHCRNYWTSKDGKLITDKRALEALLSRELTYIGSKYPLCSIFRARKFIQRGWQINAGQYLKMALQLNQLDLFNIDVLEDQLVGVDAYYFMNVIETMRSKGEAQIDANYLVEVINRIFDSRSTDEDEADHGE